MKHGQGLSLHKHTLEPQLGKLLDQVWSFKSIVIGPQSSQPIQIQGMPSCGITFKAFKALSPKPLFLSLEPFLPVNSGAPETGAVSKASRVEFGEISKACCGFRDLIFGILLLHRERGFGKLWGVIP